MSDNYQPWANRDEENPAGSLYGSPILKQRTSGTPGADIKPTMPWGSAQLNQAVQRLLQSMNVSDFSSLIGQGQPAASAARTAMLRAGGGATPEPTMVPGWSGQPGSGPYPVGGRPSVRWLDQPQGGAPLPLEAFDQAIRGAEATVPTSLDSFLPTTAYDPGFFGGRTYGGAVPAGYPVSPFLLALSGAFGE